MVTKTVGTGGDYADWGAAFTAIVSPLTDDLTLSQISDIDQATGAILPTLDLGTYTLTITSTTVNHGIYDECNITNIQDASGCLEINTTNGTLIVENLEFHADVATWDYAIWVTFLGTCQMHNVTVFGGTRELTDTAITVDADVGAAVTAEIWNCIVDVTNITAVGFVAALAVSTTNTGDVCTVENVTLRAIGAVNASAATMWAAETFGSTITARNVFAITGTSTGAAFLASGGSGTQASCASDDATAGSWTVATTPQINLVPADEFISLDPANGGLFLMPQSDGTIADNGETPTIGANFFDIRGRARSGTSIGSVEVGSAASGTTITATNLNAESTIEGPQILVTWVLPTHTNSTKLKLIRKLLAYPDDVTDGTELVSVQIGLAPTYYVDLNPTALRAYCYAAYTYHECDQIWTAAKLIEQGQTVIPTVPNGYFYEAISRGVTDATEPAVWDTEIGNTLTDGTVVWKCRSVNPGWVTGYSAKDAAFTWDSEYMQNLPFRTVPEAHRVEDAKSTIRALVSQQDSSYYNVWNAIHDDGTIKRGEFQRFLMIFGIGLSRVKGATDFYPFLIDPDECLPQYLPYLAGNVGWNLNTDLPTQDQRQQIMSAVPLYKYKGTTASLDLLLTQATNVANTIVDPMSHHVLMSNRTNRLTAVGGIETDYSVWVTLTAYVRGDVVAPTDPNKTGYYYQAIVAGTSGAAEPTWPTNPVVPNGDVVDGTVKWRLRKYGVPHVTADVTLGDLQISVDDSSVFEIGRTVNLRDTTTPVGETLVISDIPDATTLEFESVTENAYTMADRAVVSYAFDWHDDETGFIWEIPVIDDFAGIDPARVRIPGEILDPSDLYSFEIIRIWFILEPGESVTQAELDKIQEIMAEFAPVDTTYVVRVEGP